MMISRVGENSIKKRSHELLPLLSLTSRTTWDGIFFNYGDYSVIKWTHAQFFLERWGCDRMYVLSIDLNFKHSIKTRVWPQDSTSDHRLLARRSPLNPTAPSSPLPLFFTKEQNIYMYVPSSEKDKNMSGVHPLRSPSGVRLLHINW